MPNQDASLDLIFQALADPARRSIIDRLCSGQASVSELARPLAMSLPSVMQHLQVLETCGLMRSRKIGRVRICRIEPQLMRQAERWISDRRSLWESRLKRLDALLALPRGTVDGDTPS